MKNKKIENNKVNYWKIISLIFIAAILIIVAIGLVRVYHFKSSFQKTNSEDITLAKELVSDYFRNKSINYSVENLMVKDKKIKTPNGERMIVEASLNSENKRESFLIDIESRQIIMHQYMESFVPFPDNRSMPFRKGGFDRR